MLLNKVLKIRLPCKRLRGMQSRSGIGYKPPIPIISVSQIRKFECDNVREVEKLQPTTRH
jgi:hypothetical protein